MNPTYSSTLDGSVLILTCNDTFNITDEQILIVICHSDGNWIPDPAKFTFSSFTTILPGIFKVHLSTNSSSSNYHALSRYGYPLVFEHH